MKISEIDFFDIEKLPPLSTPRVTEKQLQKLFELSHQEERTLFD